MPNDYWIPEPIWKNRPCYIIGGGSSLKNFPWDSLKGSLVLGCNMAFRLGVEIVPVTIFGDGVFLKRNLHGLKTYADAGGIVVTCSTKFRMHYNWIRHVEKKIDGLGTSAIGWNGNTGAAAVNLALLFGADPIYLMGFDMSANQDGETHFHNAYVSKGRPTAYKRFKKRFQNLIRDWRRDWSSRRIINLEDGTSSLEGFPKESLLSHFTERVANG